MAPARPTAPRPAHRTPSGPQPWWPRPVDAKYAAGQPQSSPILMVLGVLLTVAGALPPPAVRAHLHHHAAAALCTEPGWLQAEVRGGLDCPAVGGARVDV